MFYNRRNYRYLSFAICILFTVWLYTIISRYHFLEQYMDIDDGYQNWATTSDLKTKEKIIHIDLKGAPPKMAYFSEFFPLIKNYGATGILLEYEDMFPYVGALRDISRDDCYTQEEIKEILAKAKWNELEVIPLIQTFGHLEFVLKHDQFSGLREVSEYPSDLCPTKGESFDVIKRMIDQVIEMHPEIERLHLGADEVYNIGRCSLCRSKMSLHNIGPDDLFLEHLKKIVRYIRASYPNLRILIWDDMLRHIPLSVLKASELGPELEIVVWFYRPSIYQVITKDVWEKYGKVFGTVWGASAFKGATGQSVQLTNVSFHLDNNYDWMTVFGDISPHFTRTPGLILTGWQRYNHLTPLCELLPAGVPSLLANLAMLQSGTFDHVVHSHLSRHLSDGTTSTLIDLDPFPRPRAIQGRLTFPGHEVYTFVHEHSNLLAHLDQILLRLQYHDTLTDGIPDQSQGTTSGDSVENQLIKFKGELQEMLKTIFVAFDKVYAPRTIHEWKDSYIKPQLARIERVLSRMEY